MMFDFTMEMKRYGDKSELLSVELEMHWVLEAKERCVSEEWSLQECTFATQRYTSNTVDLC